ncbi:strawberry notch C-terminal domain-containing protein [Brasilonema sp. CT11]|nr:strawberry notch C-terminal domain-containing protein [Brasilonema sp. CT11]
MAADSPQDAYQQLVDLHDRQPALNVRSSTSVAQQAYSTPLPIAYLASVLAEVTPDTTIYEPTAGHGALLLGSNRELVTVNELNAQRAADLRAQGYTVTENDASSEVPQALHDVVIMNPPFGTVEESPGNTKQFQFGDYRTNQIDHAIALKNLRAMKPDGRAVLILGGKLGSDEAERSDQYNSRESRGFYWTLYQQYNVTDHFTIAGGLYRKQGAGFPIDVVVINGRGKSERSLPARDVPRIYKSYSEIGEFLDDVLRAKSERMVAKVGRTDSSSISAEQSNLSKPESVPEPSGTPPTVADSDVAGRATDIGGNASSPQDADERIFNSPANETSAETPHISNQRDGVDQQLDTISHLRERHYTNASAISRSLVPSENRHERGQETVVTGNVSNTGPAAESGGMATGSEQPSTEVEQPKQLPYHPKSAAQALGTLVPANMQTGVTQALTRLENQVGELDAYVADRLGYGTPEELYNYFSAEQIDAIALAVNNLEKGSGFVLGDQTGVGKGRVVSGIMRYAKQTGRIPIFITKDTPLYADIIRDLGDIGMPDFKPLVTNENLKLPLPDGRILKTDSKNHRNTLQAFQESGRLHSYDAIFTTYSQLQTVKGQETERRAFLRAFAPNSIIILDESHEAGGSTSQTKKNQGAANRADFTRELVQLSQGVLYSSATYAKNPQVMDLYFRTDMRLALSNMENLTELVASGGVPLQQTLASMLTEAGQYIRRERSFDGVSFDPIVVPVNRDVAENVSLIMAQIMEFDRLKSGVVKDMDKDLKAEAKALNGDNSTGKTGVESTNFTSIMHNVIDQMLFSIKAEETVQKTLTILRQQQPEKPVIALSNTMGSLISREAGQQGLKPGENLDVNFGSVLHRYLERSRDVIIGDPFGKKSRKRLSDEELGVAATAKFHAVHDLINQLDFGDIPASPIDYITFRLNQEGYRVGEVTGREHIAVYDAEGNTTYQRRTNTERSKAGAVKTVKSFNDGNLDVIILNRSGSTGISLHSSEKFADQKQRHMIVVQPEADINQFMQMLGRVHRTGQVIPPNFTLLMADLPAEKRPGAVLAKKMASLNANTTAARSSAFSLRDTPDFMNEYGDIVITELMKAYPDIHERLDSPLDDSDGLLPIENAIRRVTGRIPLLPINEQEILYDCIESKYKEFVATQEAMGESILEASTLNLEALTLVRMEVLAADATSNSPFCGAVYAEVCDVKAPQKPYPTLEVIDKLRKTLNLPKNEFRSQESEASIVGVPPEEAVETILESSTQTAQQQINDLHEQVRKYKYGISLERGAGVDIQFNEVSKIIEEFPVGQTVCLKTPKNDIFYGVVANVQHTGASASPVAPSTWEMHLLLADSVRELTIPLSQINTAKDNSVSLNFAEKTPENIPIYELFDHLQTRTREKRQIFTGNLLRAWEKFPGKMINFTDAKGNIRQGLLTPRGFNAEAALEQMPVSMPTVEDACRFLSEHGGQLKTGDKSLTIKPGYTGSDFLLQTPKAKDAGGKYFLDSGILEITEEDFYSVRDRMECSIEKEKLEPLLTYLMRDKGYSLAAHEQVGAARAMLGIEIPSFENIPATAELPAAPTFAVEITGETLIEEEDEADLPVQSNNINSTPELTSLNSTIPVGTGIAPSSQQKGSPEKNIAKLLEQGGILNSVMEGEEFHLKIENGPYIPLVIERHGQQLYITHYLNDNWDTYIDSEMVFNISKQGRLALAETAVTSLGREWRNTDRGFASTFSRNLLHQGFAEAIREQLLKNAVEQGVGGNEESREETPEIEVEGLRTDAQESIYDNTAPPPSSAIPFTPDSPYPSEEGAEELFVEEANNEASAEQSSNTSNEKQPTWESTVTEAVQQHHLVSQEDEVTPSVDAADDDEFLLETCVQALKDLGLESERQHHIEHLTQSQADGKGLNISAYVKSIIEGDLEKYRPYQERGRNLLNSVQTLMAESGQMDIWGGVTLKHNRYECVKKDEMLTVELKKGNKAEIILQAQGDRILSTTVKQKDLDQFTQLAQQLRLNIVQQMMDGQQR